MSVVCVVCVCYTPLVILITAASSQYAVLCVRLFVQTQCVDPKQELTESR